MYSCRKYLGVVYCLQLLVRHVSSSNCRANRVWSLLYNSDCYSQHTVHIKTSIMSYKDCKRRKVESPAAIGIDLGTTFSVVAVCLKGKVDVIANISGNRTTPSIVAFEGDERFVGEAAKDLPPGNKAYDAKRLLGRSFDDVDIQKSMRHWPFNVVEFGGTPRIELSIDGKLEIVAPEEISAAVLADMKETAEAFLEANVSKAVITVPAYFNERQRQATKDAGTIAGLDVIGIINEPTAAAIAYGLERVVHEQTVFLFDLGGGTFDVSLMKINGSKYRVIASDGDTSLGGQDFDVLLVNHFLAEISLRHGVDLSRDKEAVHDLRVACEHVKRKLSIASQASLNIYFPRQNIAHRSAISRSSFEDLCGALFNKTIEITRRVLTCGKMFPSQVDSVVLVGGSTRIPKVYSLLQDLFPGKELKQSINPDEAVAYGAAVHAAVLTGDSVMQKQVVLRDVTPLSLGIDVRGGLFDIIVPRNTPIPCEKVVDFVSSVDWQTAGNFKVYQGERPLVKDNHYLNKELIVELPSLLAGEAKVVVTFKIDCNGLLTVTAVEPTTRQKRQVTVDSSEAKLGQEEVRQMIEKAVRYKSQDEAETARIKRDLLAKPSVRL